MLNHVKPNIPYIFIPRIVSHSLMPYGNDFNDLHPEVPIGIGPIGLDESGIEDGISMQASLLHDGEDV